MLIIFFPLALIGVLFTTSLAGLSRVLVAMGHKWKSVTVSDGEDYNDGYTLVCEPTALILYKDGAEMRSIKLFRRE